MEGGLAAGHDPASQDEVLQTGEVIAVMVRDEDRIDLGVRQAGTGKALDRRAAGIELEPQTVDVDEHAGTSTLGVGIGQPVPVIVTVVVIGCHRRRRTQPVGIRSGRAATAAARSRADPAGNVTTTEIAERT